MRSLNQVPNIGGVTTDYPDGVIVDNASGVTGTALTEILYGDLIQLIHKIKRLASITENGNPDNETNGFQLLSAFLFQSLPQWVVPSDNVDFSNIKFVQYNNGIYYHITTVNTTNNPTVDTTNWYRILYWNGTSIVFANDSVISAISTRVTNLEEDTGWVDCLNPSSLSSFSVRIRRKGSLVIIAGSVIPNNEDTLFTIPTSFTAAPVTVGGCLYTDTSGENNRAVNARILAGSRTCQVYDGDVTGTAISLNFSYFV